MSHRAPSEYDGQPWARFNEARAYQAWLKANTAKPIAPAPRPVRVTIDTNGNRSVQHG